MTVLHIQTILSDILQLTEVISFQAEQNKTESRSKTYHPSTSCIQYPVEVCNSLERALACNANYEVILVYYCTEYLRCLTLRDRNSAAIQSVWTQITFTQINKYRNTLYAANMLIWISISFSHISYMMN